MSQKLVSDLCLSPDSDPSLSLKNALKIYLDDLRAARRSTATIESKRIVLEQLRDYAQEHGWPGVAGITVNHLREYLGDLQERPRWFGQRGRGEPISTSYYETIYRRIKTFFNWLIDEGEIPPPPGKTRGENPMDRIKHPRLDEKVVPTVPKDDLTTIMALTDPARYRGTAAKFRAFRNQAVLSLLADTPVRREGLTSLEVGDVDLEERRVLVTEKGRKQRYMTIGNTSAKALQRYLIEREKLHPAVADLWVDAEGNAMGPKWVHDMLKRLGERAGVPNLHAHRFRHTYTVKALEEGTPDSVLEVQAGWKRIPKTYKATIGYQQAREWHQRVSPLDRLAKEIRKKQGRRGDTSGRMA